MNAIKNIAARAVLTCGSALFCLHAFNAAATSLPIEKWTLPSGAQVFLVQSPALPMVDVQLDFDAGGRRDPAAQAGLASVTAAMLSRGVAAGAGLPALDENQLGEAWADLGASFSASAGTDRMSFLLRSLSYPDLLPQAAALAARQLAQPAFTADIWQRERERLGAELAEANTKPATVAQRAFEQTVYGAHPYGYEMTKATLARIGVADLRRFHGLLLACRARISIVGNVTREQAQALSTRLLSQLPPSAACEPLPAVPEVAALAEPAQRSIAFDSAQAHVFIGQPGYKRSDPDFFALTLGNYILGGGGFVSRLTEQVREKRGLSYSVYSYFAPGRHAGAFTVGLQTRPDQARQAVDVAQQVVMQFVADGPNETELQAAKDNLVGGFSLRVDSNRKLLDNVANIAWNDLPLNYLATWTAQMEKVTAADVKAAFARKLQPGKMVTVVVGGG
jgi:zinc protease